MWFISWLIYFFFFFAEQEKHWMAFSGYPWPFFLICIVLLQISPLFIMLSLLKFVSFNLTRCSNRLRCTSIVVSSLHSGIKLHYFKHWYCCLLGVWPQGSNFVLLNFNFLICKTGRSIVVISNDYCEYIYTHTHTHIYIHTYMCVYICIHIWLKNY